MGPRAERPPLGCRPVFAAGHTVIQFQGWRVSVALAHMAFWDTYALARLTRWEQSGVIPSSSDVDAINNAMRPLSEAIPARDAIKLALDAADAVDRKVEGLSSELAAAIEAAGLPQTLRRSVHRNEHLDDIERALDGDRSD